MQRFAPFSARLTAARCSPAVRRLLSTASDSGAIPRQLVTDDESNNVPPHVAARVGTNLHLREAHPLNTIKRAIERHFQASSVPFRTFDDMYPVVTTQSNFDELLIEPGHVSRSPSDTFYVDEAHVLRTHTSAHQNELLRAGEHTFLATGDVYRRDEIDSSHYPVFHQMEGVRVFTPDELDVPTSDSARAHAVRVVEADLKGSLEGMVDSLFGPVEKRWVDAYFPFTDPSYELEIFFEGDWLEVLGCGVMQQQILRNCGFGEQLGWAFGLGLERLAMVLFGIPDVRLFWSEDERFHSQFKKDEVVRFKPYSKYPPCLKDVTFWVPPTDFHENDLFTLIQGIAGDIVERVHLIDSFDHPKRKQESRCYRITYRHMDRSLTNEEIDVLQDRVRQLMQDDLKLELR
eukprot:PLAT12830.2.p1 GENE.PLAT12830.2~~PLAT12830.2.p1  ORF type:complete len:413 (-),score=131.97 PLAT12830.2:136-1344(-)